MAAEAGSVYPRLEDRPVKNTICLFDVDGTLTPARRVSAFANVGQFQTCVIRASRKHVAHTSLPLILLF